MHEDGGKGYSEMVRDYKRQLVQGALDAANGDTRTAAQRLGIARQNLYRLMKELGIRISRKSASERVEAAIHSVADGR